MRVALTNRKFRGLVSEGGCASAHDQKHVFLITAQIFLSSLSHFLSCCSVANGIFSRFSSVIRF